MCVKKLSSSVLLVAVLMFVSESFAILSGAYNGEYHPDSATPPAGQSTWIKTVTGSAQIYINPQPGVPVGSASFYDQTTTGRAAITRDHSNVAIDWSGNVAATMYEFKTRLYMTPNCFQSVATYPVYYFGVGMFEPGGKCITLGWFDDQLMWVDHTAAALYGVGVQWPKKDYRDASWHEFYVKKYFNTVDGFTKVDLYIDGSLIMSRPYSAFKVNGGTFNGFMVGCPTPAKCNVFVDYVQYGPTCEESITGDMDDNCAVDIIDLKIIIENWLDCTAQPDILCQ